MDDPSRYEDGDPPRSSGRVALRRGVLIGVMA